MTTISIDTRGSDHRCSCGQATTSYCQVCLKTMCPDCRIDHYHRNASRLGPED